MFWNHWAREEVWSFSYKLPEGTHMPLVTHMPFRAQFQDTQVTNNMHATESTNVTNDAYVAYETCHLQHMSPGAHMSLVTSMLRMTHIFACFPEIGEIVCELTELGGSLGISPEDIHKSVLPPLLQKG